MTKKTVEWAEDPKKILEEFLAFRPESAGPILARFAELEGAAAHFDGEKLNFVYVPGRRDDRVLLIAHADTVWDLYYCQEMEPELGQEYIEAEKAAAHKPFLECGQYYQKGWHYWGIGADDRAGCAMLWLLRDSGHSPLITDGEEHGQIASRYLTERYPALAEELNAHSYMIQLDRRGSSDYKTYDLPVTEDFRRYVEAQTGYKDAGWMSRTDIVALCEKICGVNLSVGYYNEHTNMELLEYQEWLHTLETVRKMLEGPQPRFPLLTQAPGHP